MMAQEQLGQVLRILAVILGTTGDKGFAKLLQRDRIDRIEGDPVVGLQKQDQTGGWLLQTDSHAGPRMVLAQSGEPVVQTFWRSADGALLGFGRGQVNEIKI